MARRLKTLYYPCPGCDRILDAGGLETDVWIRCPTCDRAHLPPTHIDEVARPRKRARQRLEVGVEAVAASNVGRNGEGSHKVAGPVLTTTLIAPRSPQLEADGDALNSEGATASDDRSPSNDSPTASPLAPAPAPEPRARRRRDDEEDWGDEDEPLDPIAAFERRRKRDRRIKQTENALLRRVFGLSLFLIVSAWTAWNCFYHWDEVGPTRLIIFGVAIVFSLFIAFADLLKRDRD